ncbi:hypothetical protein [Cryobacterium lactosi]|uniref:hypothetical protein n=1 Tax=Cryobacterium lactosi TaxID=1259202 RepID=UPI00141AADAD|nr:hypothetical protein [Cryobacterium lactosi]
MTTPPATGTAATALGGLALIDALTGPFPGVRFMPSGGVSTENLGDYLAHPAVFSAGCSWIASRSTLARGQFDDIRARAAAATAIARAATAGQN